MNKPTTHKTKIVIKTVTLDRRKGERTTSSIKIELIRIHAHLLLPKSALQEINQPIDIQTFLAHAQS